MIKAFKLGPFRFRKTTRGWSWTYRAGKMVSFGGTLGKKAR